ncbi:benzoate 4-monooxygenase cytochrome p450 [Moniliophthora roreri MCA 2997]|uniref:Benzoate 4-monooxygenase cytochrome p450 n=1 Tax=Moniliophthora roreri (strain MCA 2997) TaxID=1381753 RepID=V2X2G3_MONRO|nr:benzoate 4-monooxygenase cytochrome p450 [Moniliophthora roreri MCA 2997]
MMDIPKMIGVSELTLELTANPLLLLSAHHGDTARNRNCARGSYHPTDDISFELHRVYGPVVRVGPRELHFSDPNAYDDIYLAKFIKDPNHYKALPVSDALVSTTDPQEASKRRLRLGPYFSRKAVLELESQVQKNVNRLIETLSSFTPGGRSADLLLAYRSTSVDIMTSYLFSHKVGALDVPNFQHPLVLVMDSVLQNVWIQKHFLSPFPLENIPHSILRRIAPAMNPFLDLIESISQKVGEYTLNPPSTDDAGHKLVFDVFLSEHRDDSSASPWTVPRKELLEECLQLQFAGTDTIASTCMVGSFHLLREQDALARLKKELVEAWPDMESHMTYDSLERLPYLTAVIKESLRLSPGGVSPFPRVVGPSGATVAGCEVPDKTTVSCASYFVHTNPSIFPVPDRFIPERWLGSNTRELEKYLVPFTKGPRTCLGINLAWCELYLIFANVYRKLDLTLDDTHGKPSLEFRDYLLPLYCGNKLRAFAQLRCP